MSHLAMYNALLRDPHAILHLVPPHTQHKLSCHIHILSIYPSCIFRHMFQVSGAKDKRHVRKLSLWQRSNLGFTRWKNTEYSDSKLFMSMKWITHHTHPFQKFFWANSCACICSKFHFTNFLVNFLHKMYYKVNQFMFIHLLCMEVSY